MLGGAAVERFAGVGLRNVILIALMTMLLIVMFKVIFNKYEIKGFPRWSMLFKKGGLLDA